MIQILGYISENSNEKISHQLNSFLIEL